MITKLIHPGLFKRISPSTRDHLIHCLWDGFSTASYSQEGEDTLLNRMFDSKKGGFFVDVGAHHPKRFSNTFLFYRRGWRGINIDAMPGSMRPFEAERPGDTNIECGVGTAAAEITFYTFRDGALNTFDADIARIREAEGAGPAVAVVVPVRRLESILGEHLQAGTKIDFMSVDAEGFDYDILESNDWEKFRPSIVLVEICQCSMEETMHHRTTGFLAAQGYGLVAKTVNTAFYRTMK